MAEKSVIPLDLEVLKQYGAWLILFILGIWKVIKPAIPFIKKFFTGKSIKTDVKVTVNNNQNYDSHIPDFSKSAKKDFRYFLYFLLEQGKILKAMNDLKSNILADQMDNFSKHVQAIKISATNVIVGLLKDVDLEDTAFGTYFTNFENFIDIAEIYSTNTFRHMCKKNGFSECTASGFKELIDVNISIIEGNLDELLRSRYPQKLHIKNFQRIDTIKPLIRSALFDCFEYARQVSIEKENKVKKAKEDFEKQMSDILGMKYTLEI